MFSRHHHKQTQCMERNCCSAFSIESEDIPVQSIWLCYLFLMMVYLACYKFGISCMKHYSHLAILTSSPTYSEHNIYLTSWPLWGSYVDLPGKTMGSRLFLDNRTFNALEESWHENLSQICMLGNWTLHFSPIPLSSNMIKMLTYIEHKHCSNWMPLSLSMEDVCFANYKEFSVRWYCCCRESWGSHP